MVPSCSISSDPPLLASGADTAQLPPLVAAAILMTTDYAAPSGGTVEGSLHVAGWLPETLRFFGGRRWCGDWTGDRASIWLTPREGERVRYDPPPGYVEIVDAIGGLASALRGRIREAILSETLIAGRAAGEANGAKVIADYGDRFGELVTEVLIALREEMDTAHGRLRLRSELRDRSVSSAAAGQGAPT